MPFLALNLVSVIFSFFIDELLGDPKTRLHPVVLMGKMNKVLEKYLYRFGFIGGALLTLISATVCTLIALLLMYISYEYNIYLYITVNSLIIYTTISVKSMKEHAMRVYEPLSDGDLHSACVELSKIVSRDTENMGEEQITKSTIESVSENYTDGVLSPSFYACFGGGAGAIFFKAVSTLDSMIGYKNERYILFGKFAARFDDVLNFIPARLSVLMIALAAPFCRMSFKNTLKTASDYRFAHESPNSAHSMSAFAGAMGITLGGAVSYFGKIKNKPYIGNGTRVIEADMIKEAIKLFEAASIVLLTFLVIFYFFIRFSSGCPLCA